MSVQAKYDDAATNVTRMVQADGVSARVAGWLETGDGYPEAFSVDEMEAIYAFARLGRWAWFREMQDHTSSGAPMFDAKGGRE